MAVDKSYGSGKSRSAANSSARRRVAAGQLTKSKKSPAEKIKAGRAKMAASPLGQLADTVLGFALPVGKVKAAAAGLRAAGKIAQATALEARVAAKNAGQVNGGFGNATMGAVQGMPRRAASESLYPKLPSRGGDAPGLLRGQRDLRTFDKYADPINEGAGRFKSQNLLDTMIQGSTTRSGMNRVKVASDVAKKLSKYKTPKTPKKKSSGGSFSADTRWFNRAIGKVTQRELDLDNGYFKLNKPKRGR